jgi:hypothetical protein
MGAPTVRGAGASVAPGASSGTTAVPFEAAGTGAPPVVAPGAGAKPTRGGVTSTDWAGYVDTGTTFTSVAGSWVQPTAGCTTNKVQRAAFWVGIGGYLPSDPDIEQIGTDADCTKGHGKNPGGSSYYAWFQLYPQSLVVLPTSSYPVSPGQTFDASVSGSGPSYTLTIVDVGHWIYSTNQSQATKPAAQSAEWITEAPSSCTAKCKVLPLAPFGSIGYSGASADGSAINGGGLTSTKIDMTNKSGKTVYASTSTLGGSGNAFTVTWLAN